MGRVNYTRCLLYYVEVEKPTICIIDILYTREIRQGI